MGKKQRGLSALCTPGQAPLDTRFQRRAPPRPWEGACAHPPNPPAGALPPTGSPEPINNRAGLRLSAIPKHKVATRPTSGNQAAPQGLRPRSGHHTVNSTRLRCAGFLDKKSEGQKQGKTGFAEDREWGLIGQRGLLITSRRLAGRPCGLMLKPAPTWTVSLYQPHLRRCAPARLWLAPAAPGLLDKEGAKAMPNQ